MKLNNKGVTLIELIISVVLVTIIMGFMYKLILDANNMQNNDSFASKNQLKRNEIIKTIENDLINIKGIKVKDLSTVNKTIIDISDDAEGNKELIITIGQETINGKTKDYILYESKLGSSTIENHKWTMEDCTLSRKVLISSETSNSLESMLLTIEVYTENDANNNCSDCTNNVIDDIVISYSGINANLSDPIPACIGNGC